MSNQYYSSNEGGYGGAGQGRPSSSALEACQKELNDERLINDELSRQLSEVQNQADQYRLDLDAANRRIVSLENEIALSARSGSAEAPLGGRSALPALDRHAHFDPPANQRVGNLDNKYWGESQEANQPQKPPRRAMQDSIYWGESQGDSNQNQRAGNLDNKYWGESQQQQQPPQPQPQAGARRAMQDSNIFGESPQNEQQGYGRRRVEPAAQQNSAQPPAAVMNRRAMQDSGIFGDPKPYEPRQQPQNAQASAEPEGEPRRRAMEDQMFTSPPPQNTGIDAQLKALQEERNKIDQKFRQAKPAGMSLARFRRDQEEFETRLDDLDKQISRIRLQIKQNH